MARIPFVVDGKMLYQTTAYLDFRDKIVKRNSKIVSKEATEYGY